MFGPLLGNAAIIGSLQQGLYRASNANYLAQSQAAESALAQYQNLAGLSNANVVPIREPVEETFRTPEEIQAQLEARLEEMKAEAEQLRLEDQKPEAVYPCSSCRFRSGNLCLNPLVAGLKMEPKLHFDRAGGGHPKLCGREKALWEPKLPWYLKLWNWFLAPWQ